MDILSELIRDRKDKKIKMTDISKGIGISKQLIGRLENGKSIPNLRMIERYADYLGYEIRLLKK
jgi:transcriptional regulator with XRE-family HTH domain